MDHYFYAVRRLNPFRGVTQIVRAEECRAISTNGQHWEIHIRVRQPDDLWGRESQGTPVYRYIRFGTWSETQGLKSVPAHPLLDIKQMLHKTEELIQLVQSETKQLPFPLKDNFELWLLDGQQRMPLALLESVVNPVEMSLYTAHKWIAAETTSNDFPSPAADNEHPPHPRDTNPHPHLSALTNIMRDNAGHALAQWFERTPDGSGYGIKLPGFDEFTGRALEKHHFPELLIRPHRADCYEEALIDDYLVWQSPLLLTLQALSDKTRKRLEQHATHQALQVNELWRLYPKTVDSGFINKARVEARIRTAGTTT